MKLKKNKKGQIFSGITQLVIGLAVVGLVLTVGFLIYGEAQTQIESIDGVNSTGQNSSGHFSSKSYNATWDIETATDDISGWMSIIVVVVIGALLIGLISRFRRR